MKQLLTELNVVLFILSIQTKQALLKLLNLIKFLHSKFNINGLLIYSIQTSINFLKDFEFRE
jgi:hypothetical protein